MKRRNNVYIDLLKVYIYAHVLYYVANVICSVSKLFLSNPFCLTPYLPFYILLLYLCTSGRSGFPEEDL